MKITEIEVLPLGYMRTEPSLFVRTFAIMKVSTDEGIVGWGETSDGYGHSLPLTVKQFVEEEVARNVIGRDPLQLERLIWDLHQFLYRMIGHHGLVSQALSALEIALWDIVGKARGLPVHALLGTHRDRVRLYAGGTMTFDHEPEWYGQYFDGHRDRGVTAVKVRIGNNFRWDVATIEGARRYLGPDVDLLVDVKYNYQTLSALRLVEALKDYDIYFLEEPLPTHNIEGMATLVASSAIPIAYGENISAVEGFKTLIDRKAANVFEPDPTYMGGLIEARKAATIADAWGIQVSPHCGGLTAIGMAALVHYSASIPNFTLLEYDAVGYQPLRDELVKDPIFSLDRVVDGCLEVPDGPGLGIEVDESTIPRFPVIVRESGREFPNYGFPHI